MSNTISDLYQDLVIDQVVGALKKRMPRLSGFSTDVSAQAVEPGTASINVPLIGQPTANTHTGDYTANADTTDSKAAVSFPSSGHKVATFHLTNVERMQISNGVWTASAREKVLGAANAIIDAAMQIVFAKITVAAFSAEKVVAAVDFDGAELGAQRTWANQQGFGPLRAVVIPSDYMETLTSDSTLASYFAANDPAAVREGGIVRAKGFNLIEYDNIPSNSQSLKGIVVDPRAIAVALRVPMVAQDVPAGEYIMQEVITDPDSGASLLYTVWFDRKSRATYHNVEALIGAAVGRATALRRLVSQANA